MRQIYPIIEFPAYLSEIKHSQPNIKSDPFDKNKKLEELSLQYPKEQLTNELQSIRMQKMPSEPPKLKPFFRDKGIKNIFGIISLTIIFNIFSFVLLVLIACFTPLYGHGSILLNIQIFINIFWFIFIIHIEIKRKRMSKIYSAEYDLYLNQKKEYEEKQEYYRSHNIVKSNNRIDENIEYQLEVLAKEHKKKLEAMNSEDFKINFRRGLFNDKIKHNTIYPNASFFKESDFTGKSESFFFDFIKNDFTGKIFNDKTFRDTPYKPDILIHDSYNNIIINIEIDEPYSIISGEPIHFQDADTNRNSYFLSKGWFIIRFAEEQIVKQPEICRTLVIDVYKAILYSDYNKIIEKKFDYPPIVTQWSKQEAINMYSRRFRDSYLHLLKKY